ncbi:MAG: hypothetical protein UR26_C0001G0098 [candidate division TM6 bacterium GW2011_GWF2_32_72]|nr:MAG: hypothetical protein UR26_C0001G0098 [candidate division TM6 bacterium GW2011_GWF2_32_72]
MILFVLSPNSKETYEVSWVEVDTIVGNFVIQLGHAPMIISLSPHSKLNFCLKSGKVDFISVSSGVIEVSRSFVKLFLN